jgi:hypothetical protein
MGLRKPLAGSRLIAPLAVAAVAALSVPGASSSASSRWYSLRVGDAVDVNGLYFGCSYSRPSGRRAFACGEDGDPQRSLGVVVFRDRVVVLRGNTVIYRAFR